MPISAAYEGTETVGTTEWSMTTDTSGPDSQTDDGVYQAIIDMTNMANGDTFEFRVYDAVLAAGSQRCVFSATFANARGADAGWTSPSFILMHGWDMTLKKIGGTDRSFDWSIRKVA